MNVLSNRKHEAPGRDISVGYAAGSDLWRDESGMGTVEIILIIVVLIGLVVVFREQLTKLVSDVFKRITEQAGGILN